MKIEAPSMVGGVVSLGMGLPPPVAEVGLDDIEATLQKGYDPPQQYLIGELIALLKDSADDDQALMLFQQMLNKLLASENACLLYTSRCV